jgi:hypothetical protein
LNESSLDREGHLTEKIIRRKFFQIFSLKTYNINKIFSFYACFKGKTLSCYKKFKKSVYQSFGYFLDFAKRLKKFW